MTRLRAVLAALGLTAALLAAGAPAQAEVQARKCVSFGSDGHSASICLVVNYIPSSHTITLVQTQASGEVSREFESKVEDCDNLRLWNDNQTVIWRKDDAQCDLTQSDPVDTWFPGNQLPQSDHAHFGWTFYPKLNLAPDPGYTHISIDITF